MILHDHGSAAVAIKTYIAGHGERVARWIYLVIGIVSYYLLSKLVSLFKSYARDREAEGLAARQRVLETGRGWLDYRLENPQGSCTPYLPELAERANSWPLPLLLDSGLFPQRVKQRL